LGSDKIRLDFLHAVPSISKMNMEKIYFFIMNFFVD